MWHMIIHAVILKNFSLDIFGLDFQEDVLG